MAGGLKMMYTPEDWAIEAARSTEGGSAPVLYPAPPAAKLAPADIISISREKLIGLFAACAREAAKQALADRDIVG